MAPPPPPCQALGPQCRSLPVTLRVASLEDGSESVDHEATWLLGHAGHIVFGPLHQDDQALFVEARLEVGCRHLSEAGGQARCQAHGFEGPTPVLPPGSRTPRQLGDHRFRIVEAGEEVVRTLAPAPRSLPMLESDNPCHGAPCRTADHVQGSACCRDLQLTIMCPPSQPELEALVRSRRSPYLCKITRENEDALEVEMISPCGYLDPAGRDCTLHGRNRPSGRPAKPDICRDWPPKGKGLHPGCVFRPAPAPMV